MNIFIKKWFLKNIKKIDKLIFVYCSVIYLKHLKTKYIGEIIRNHN
jgi:hypothetical protein